MLAIPIADRGTKVEDMRLEIERWGSEGGRILPWESEGGRILPAEGRSKVVMGDGRGPYTAAARVDHAAHRPTPSEPHSD